LTTAEVAERYRTAEATVRYWRHIGYGPKGVKVGRRVLYPVAEIERFDASLFGEQETDRG
jgi:DNA-binding transcriptional MerR regulator